MRALLTIAIACISLLSCTHTKQNTTFVSSIHEIDCDTTLTAIVYAQGYIIGAQHNGRLLVLDSNYQRQPALEAKYNREAIQDLIAFHDTVFILTDGNAYYLHTSMTWEHYKGDPNTINSSIGEDEQYWINGCCAGESCGAVSFFDKHTDKIYFYPIACANYAVKYHNGYWVCANAINDSSTAYLFIPNPKKLYEHKIDSTNPSSCLCWGAVDSTKNYRQLSAIGGVQQIAGPDNSRTVQNFIYNDSLYTIVTNHKNTSIAVLRRDSMVVKEVLFNDPLHFNYEQTIVAGNRTISLVNIASDATYDFSSKASILLVSKGNEIDKLIKKKDAKK